MLSYLDGETPSHRIDPFTKFIWVSVVTVWLLSIDRLLPVVLWCVGIIGGVEAGLCHEFAVETVLTNERVPR